MYLNYQTTPPTLAFCVRKALLGRKEVYCFKFLVWKSPPSLNRIGGSVRGSVIIFLNHLRCSLAVLLA